MIILIKEMSSQKTEVTINGFSTIHKTNFLNKLSYKDAINYIKSKSK